MTLLSSLSFGFPFGFGAGFFGTGGVTAGGAFGIGGSTTGGVLGVGGSFGSGFFGSAGSFGRGFYRPATVDGNSRREMAEGIMEESQGFRGRSHGPPPPQSKRYAVKLSFTDLRTTHAPTIRRNIGNTALQTAGTKGLTCKHGFGRVLHRLGPPVTIPEMGLPNADHAEVDSRKLTEYCLSPTHPVGKHKAAVFRAALGITIADADTLQDWLLEAAVSGEAVAERVDAFGQRFRIDFEAVTATGQATIRSAWIIRAGEDVPRLTTCYVLGR